MENKTKIFAEEGKQDIIITREFDAPVELLFEGFIKPELIGQWMGTNVLKFEPTKFGSYEFQTEHNGHIVFRGVGAFHDIILNKKIIRTFEMENSEIDVQLEFLEFEKLSDSRSKLTKQIIYKSNEHRAIQLKMPFEFGLNMAHNQLEKILLNK